MESKKTIMKLYNEYVAENNIPNKEYSKLKDEFETVLNELVHNIPDKEKTKLEKVCECLLKMGKEQETNAFVEGYTLGTNITTEAIYRGIK